MKTNNNADWKTSGYRILSRATPDGKQYRYRGLDRFSIGEIVVTHEWQGNLVSPGSMLVNMSGCICTHPESSLGKIMMQFESSDSESFSSLESAYSLYRRIEALELDFELVAYEISQNILTSHWKDASQGWPIMGFDVADILGFFSILNDVVVQKQPDKRNNEYKALFEKFHPALNDYGLLSDIKLASKFHSYYQKLPNQEVLEQVMICRLKMCPTETSPVV